MKAIRRVCLGSLLGGLFLPILWAESVNKNQVPIETVIEDEMGLRAPRSPRKIIWNDSICHELGREVMVHQQIDANIDPQPIIDFAKEYNMPRKDSFSHRVYGIESDQKLWFSRKGHFAAWINPRMGFYLARIQKPGDFEFSKEGDRHPIVTGMPSREEAIKIAEKWMERFHIDKGVFYKDPEGKYDYNIKFRMNRVSSYDSQQKKSLQFYVGMRIIFGQQIGDLRAGWRGWGGNVTVDLNDGGEFAQLANYLKHTKPLRKAQLLTKEELDRAIKAGFFWQYHTYPVGDEFNVTGIHVEAHCRNYNKPQTHFTPLYVIYGTSGGKEHILTIPALREHRNLYQRQKAKPQN